MARVRSPDGDKAMQLWLDSEMSHMFQYIAEELQYQKYRLNMKESINKEHRRDKRVCVAKYLKRCFFHAFFSQA